MSNRSKIPPETQAEVLLSCARRCCLCFGLQGDVALKKGQIAHLNQDRTLNEGANLVYLCLEHHDEFDSATSQSKGLTRSELVTYRRRLHEYVQTSLSPASTSKEVVASSIEQEDAVLDTIERYWKASSTSPSTLASEIKLRMQRIRDYHRLAEEELDKPSPNISESEKNKLWEFSSKRFREALGLPEGIWGLLPDGIISEKKFRTFDVLADGWSQGLLSYKECDDLFWLLDEDLDFDQYFILYGLPLDTLGPVGSTALHSFIYEFGMRNTERA
jgi:hypothetical protein